MLVPGSGTTVCIIQGLSLPPPAKGFTTTALRARLADALMTEARFRWRQKGERAGVVRRKMRSRCRARRVGKKVRYACRTEAACKMEKGRESQRWLAGSAATGIGLLSDLTWGGLSGTGTAPPKRRYYVTTPDGDMSCQADFGTRRSTADSGEKPQGHRVGSWLERIPEQAREPNVPSAVAGFVSGVKFQK